jgi:AhpC/TSA family
MFLIDYRAICVILCAPKSSHACPSLSPSPASKDQPGSGSSKTAVRHAPICAPRRRQACIACLGRRAVTSNRAYNCQYETCSATSPPRRGLSSPFNYLPEGTVEDGPNFPIVADADRSVAMLYGMIGKHPGSVLTEHSLFVVDPHGKIQLIQRDPPSERRCFAEILHIVESLRSAEA